MSKPFKYKGGSRTAEQEMRASKRSSGAFESYLTDGVTFYKPREGENKIRLLPCAWEDTERWSDSWDIEVYVHMGIGANEDSYLCLNKMKDEDCPICNAGKASKDREEARQFTPKLRPLCYVIDRDNMRIGPQAYPMPITLNKEIHARSVNKKTGDPYHIDHPTKGFDVEFTKEGTNLNTKYVQVQVDVGNPSPISTNADRQEKWLKHITENALPDLLNYYEADHLEDVLNGGSSRKKTDADDDDEKPRGKVARKRGKVVDEDEDEADERATRSNKRRVVADDEDEEVPFEADSETEDEDDEPKAKRGRPKGKAKAKRKPVDEDEDDEEPEADEGEGEDEEDTPPKRGRKPSKASDDDDDTEGDEEDEGDEDDEDEPAPRKGRKPSRRASADEDDEEEADEGDDDAESDDEEEDETPTKTARSKLAKLKARKGR